MWGLILPTTLASEVGRFVTWFLCVLFLLCLTPLQFPSITCCLYLASHLGENASLLFKTVRTIQLVLGSQQKLIDYSHSAIVTGGQSTSYIVKFSIYVLTTYHTTQLPLIAPLVFLVVQGRCAIVGTLGGSVHLGAIPVQNAFHVVGQHSCTRLCSCKAVQPHQPGQAVQAGQTPSGHTIWSLLTLFVGAVINYPYKLSE